MLIACDQFRYCVCCMIIYIVYMYSSKNVLHFAEVSDQNFSDEETKGERMSKFCFAKKMKTRMGDASSHDQVRPPVMCKFFVSKSWTEAFEL